MEELCLLCGKLVLLEDMKRHMDRVHENSKNVKCSDCDLIFASDKKMMNHRIIHNVKLFICDAVNCQYLSKNKSNLEQHKKVVHCLRTALYDGTFK